MTCRQRLDAEIGHWKRQTERLLAQYEFSRAEAIRPENLVNLPAPLVQALVRVDAYVRCLHWLDAEPAPAAAPDARESDLWDDPRLWTPL